ncbi:hypothetical protein D3C86_2207130 [compost metagenome]
MYVHSLAFKDQINVGVRKVIGGIKEVKPQMFTLELAGKIREGPRRLTVTHEPNFAIQTPATHVDR